MHVVFPELLSDSSTTLLEVGCGVGNVILPLLEVNPQLNIIAVDFAESAIKLLRENQLTIHSDRIRSEVCCVINDDLPVAAGSLDLVLCMFVLSAIAPEVL